MMDQYDKHIALAITLGKKVVKSTKGCLNRTAENVSQANELDVGLVHQCVNSNQFIAAGASKREKADKLLLICQGVTAAINLQAKEYEEEKKAFIKKWKNYVKEQKAKGKGKKAKPATVAAQEFDADHWMNQELPDPDLSFLFEAMNTAVDKNQIKETPPPLVLSEEPERFEDVAPEVIAEELSPPAQHDVHDHVEMESPLPGTSKLSAAGSAVGSADVPQASDIQETEEAAASAAAPAPAATATIATVEAAPAAPRVFVLERFLRRHHPANLSLVPIVPCPHEERPIFHVAEEDPEQQQPQTAQMEMVEQQETAGGQLEAAFSGISLGNAPGEEQHAESSSSEASILTEYRLDVERHRFVWNTLKASPNRDLLLEDLTPLPHIRDNIKRTVFALYRIVEDNRNAQYVIEDGQLLGGRYEEEVSTTSSLS